MIEWAPGPPDTLETEHCARPLLTEAEQDVLLEASANDTEPELEANMILEPVTTKGTELLPLKSLLPLYVAQIMLLERGRLTPRQPPGGSPGSDWGLEPRHDS